ncbi:hypothetical protein D3C75_932520 [compost metagenome]
MLEQRRGRHYLAGLAVAALGHLVLDPGRDHPFADGIGLDRLDGGHLAPDHAGHRGDAGAHHVAVHQHRTGAALGQAAAILGAGQPQVIADHPQQGRVGVCLDLVGLLVDA